MKKNYIEYNAPRFAADPFFLQWRIAGNRKSCLFWEEFLREHPEKEEQIQEAIRIVQTIKINDYKLSPPEAELLLERVKNSGKQIRRRRRRLAVGYSVAAAMALLLSLTLLLPSGEADDSLRQQMEQAFNRDEGSIRLITASQKTFELSNNADIVYQDQGGVQIRNGQQDDVLHDQEQLSSGMNTLIVPHGKRTSLTLPDSTRIWLNAGSRVEFPTRFAAGKREIYAEGEVYLEVAKDAGRTFTVRTPFYSVLVLGTKFNISAYRDGQPHSVVLVEGAVEVKIENHTPYRLSPRQKLTLTDRQTEISGVDPYGYISWKDGILQFSQESLQTILKRLSHYYGTEIHYVPGDRDLINGKLVLFDDIRTVLDNISVIVPITYTIENNRIQVVKKQ